MSIFFGDKDTRQEKIAFNEQNGFYVPNYDEPKTKKAGVG